MKSAHLFLGISAWALAIPSLALAAEDAEADAAESAPGASDIVVTGERTKEAGSIVPVRKPTSIYGTEESILDTPRSVTQINSEQLTKDIILSSDDLAKYTPGITRGGGQNAGIAPQLRGQGTEIFQDGQRGYSVRHPSNFNAYESADIVAGPSSVIFGSVTGSGGYINYISKKPAFDGQHTSVTARLGTWYPGKDSKGAFTISADTTGPISDTLAYRISGTIQRQNDYYDNVENNFNAIYAALSWKPDSKFTADLNFAYDDYYDWNVTHGWNRATQELVDSGQY
ncbi:MAG: TonB-dependent receptor plug domain-containing protein [Novosphingobium sp.]